LTLIEAMESYRFINIFSSGSQKNQISSVCRGCRFNVSYTTSVVQ